MKMYKILTLALAAPLFVACGGSTPEASAPEQPAAEAKKADGATEAKPEEAAAPAEEAAPPAEEKPAEAAPAEEKKDEKKKK